jgi:hypothetical protein
MQILFRGIELIKFSATNTTNLNPEKIHLEAF